jgi:putative tryptophan/tyrosine transport system substrate-binding protein
MKTGERAGGAAATRRLVLAAAGMWLLPRGARGQAKRRRIATLAQGTRTATAANWEAFRQGLRALGYVAECRNREPLGGRTRRAAAGPRRRTGAARPGSRRRRVGRGGRGGDASDLDDPIVVTILNNPVGSGLDAGLARPGGNVTGLSTMQGDTVATELELLETAVPGATRIAVLVDPSNPSHGGVLQTLRQAAQGSGTTLLPIDARAADEVEGAFTAMARAHAGALVVLGGPLVLTQRSRIAELAASHKLPAIYYERELAAAGGLMSYGADPKDMNRRAATYVDKILKGANPADLPIERPTKFELVVNLKTAKRSAWRSHRRSSAAPTR